MSSKKIALLLSFIFVSPNIKAQSYYVSAHKEMIKTMVYVQPPFKSEKLNSINFNAGDSIYFKSGDYWEGMFWLKGSGTLAEPIVVDVYGENTKPIINGFGYQASVLIFNDQHIHINGLELYNSANHFDSASTTTISAQTPNLFSNGPNNSWLMFTLLVQLVTVTMELNKPL